MRENDQVSTPHASPSKSRPGFSLVLTLVILAMLTLTVLLSAAFINIESRLAMQNQLATRARMNAVGSLRLAMAHLQQEAGPDRRMTARADITADKMQSPWTWTRILNPLWTGVWRSDRPLQPPAWLVSGRHDRPAGAQSASLFGVNLSNVANYDGLALAPWDRTYAPPAQNLVTLVGDASASGPIDQSGANPGKPDGRIRLPRVPLPDQGVNGNYAYWVGDEGVKARINLRDPRLDPATATDQSKQQALRGVARSGLEILSGFNANSIPASGLDPRVNSFQALSLQPTGITETTPPTVAKRLFTETTFWSRGVNCDSQFGGLKIDLSNAFELSDTDWGNTEFSTGSPPKDSANQNLSPVTYTLNGFDNTPDPVAFKNIKVSVINSPDGRKSDVSPVYQFAPRSGSAVATGSTNAIGPTWEALRNYYRLYKEINWATAENPTLTARAHFPNTVSLNNHNSSLFPFQPDKLTLPDNPANPRQNIDPHRSHYGYWYNRQNCPADNFTAGGNFSNFPAPRPVKVAATAYVARQLVVWGLYNVRGVVGLSLTPITVLHNPYNVSLSLDSKTAAGSNAGMRISFTNWASWPIQMAVNGTSSDKTLGLLSGASGDVMNLDIPSNTTLAPGELRIFSPSAGFVDIGGVSPNITARPGLFFDGGFFVPLADDSKSGNDKRLRAGDAFEVRLLNTGKFVARHLLRCWELDDLTNISSRCSEVTQLRAESLARSGTGKLIQITPGDVVPSNGSLPIVVGVYDYGVRWPRESNAIPLFTQTNPMATTCRADANGWTTQPSGFAHTSPSFYFRLNSPDNTSTVMASSGSNAFGGLSNGTGGVTSAVYTEIPLSPPTSLAQLSHANFTLRDQDPLLAIGNSFGTPFNDVNAMGRLGNGIWDWDHSWMLNSALFDRFYFSGAAPEIRRGSTVSESKSLSLVLDEFVAGTGSLSNPRTVLFSNRDPAAVRAMVGNHRRIAGATLTEGAFNVNSTSVEAWTAVLAAAKRNAMGGESESQPSSTENARFPRAVRAAKNVNGRNTSSASFNDAKAWTGLTTLSDGQIRLLAKSIVDEVRYRAQIVHRSPVQRFHSSLIKSPDYQCRSDRLDIPAPFTGMGQFINRNLCGWDAQRSNSLSGCLQNAITRADVDGAKLSNRNQPGTLLQGPDSALISQVSVLNSDSTTPGSVPWTPGTSVPYDVTRGNITFRDPRDDSLRAHTLVGAPTSLTQADILAAIGSGLSTRSDTFVIRCYGDAMNPAGDASARCWIEAVVQRTPEFVDASQPPETEVCNPSDSYRCNFATTANPNGLRLVNNVLGRRFQVVAIRQLLPQEL